MNSVEARTCVDSNSCGTSNSKPAESQSCSSDLTIDYSPENFDLTIANETSIPFSVSATHTIPSTSISVIWFLDGVQQNQDSSSGSVVSSFSELFTSNSQVRVRVQGGGEDILLTWDVQVVESDCVEDWDCAAWTYCENNAAYSYPLECQDLNECGTNLYQPQKQLCTCQATWDCTEWDVCSASYNVSDILDENVLSRGEQSRVCNDLKECYTQDKIEYQSCSIAISVRAERVEWCNETYVEIYDNTNDELLSRVKETEVLSQDADFKKVDISFITTDFEGYCGYCANGVRDYDEAGVDCGGSNCPACLGSYSLAKWPTYVIWFLWILLVSLFVVLAMLERQQKDRTPYSARERAVEKWIVHETELVGVKKWFKSLGIRRVERRVEGVIESDLKALDKKTAQWKQQGYYDVHKLERHMKEHKQARVVEKPSHVQKLKHTVQHLIVHIKHRHVVRKIARQQKKVEKAHRKAIKRATQPQSDKAMAKMLRKLRGWRKQGYYDAEKLERNIKDKKK